MWWLEKVFPRSQCVCVIQRSQPAQDLGGNHSEPWEPQVQRPWGRSMLIAGHCD